MTEQKAIYAEVSSLLVKLFEVDPQDIKPEARLYEDLELDSIDAVDMIVHLQKKTGKRVQSSTHRTRCRRCGRTPSQRSVILRVGHTLVASRTTADRSTVAGLAVFDLVWPGA